MPPIREASLCKREILSPDGSRSRDDPPSIQSSWYSEASWVRPEVIEGYFAGVIFRHGVDAIFVRACNFLPIWCDILAMVTFLSSFPFSLV